MVIIVSNPVFFIYLKDDQRVDFKSSHTTHTHTKCNYVMDVLTYLTVVIILQYIHISDHYIVHSKLK